MLNRICPLAVTARASTALQAALPTISQTAGVHHHLERGDLNRYLGIHRSNKARANRNTHVNEKMFRKMRGRKTIVVDLPDHEEQKRLDNLPAQQMRIEMLKKGINPYKEVQPRIWQEAQVTMQSFYGVIDPYVTPEIPLPISSLASAPSLKAAEVQDRGKHIYHNYVNGTRRIKKKEGFEKFDAKLFGPTADDIYQRAHKALMQRDKKELMSLITEHAYAKMWPDVEQGSIIWELVEHVSPSKVVTIRCADNPYKSGNDIAQLTVRMHTKQILAVYDRFGHLILGSKTEPREVVEYVVFENHIAVFDGKWRLHDKVYPQWSKAKQGAQITQVLDGEHRPEITTALPLRVEELSKERAKNEKKEEE